ncbi:4Fe-4S double cluster binding domain-containing protein [Ottowia thiooxydans]|uniref:4Fe-4S double cluster binding domain-containing protein n=1 Tax=Ottowia thiooxydans TaxID=219182 RepID=UPI000409BEF3|nr:reductive dehalogenase domain-containing protein [Ottowia thiooxydans]
MRIFSHTQRAVHDGAYPSERLSRRAGSSTQPPIRETGALQPPASNELEFTLADSVSRFMCALDQVREGDHNKELGEIPSDAMERARHLKSAAYFLDTSIAGVSELKREHLLDLRIEHPTFRTATYEQSETKLRLRFNPNAVLRQMKRSMDLCEQGVEHHTHALVLMVEFPRDPQAGEPGADWIVGMQQWRAALRAAETAAVLANYIRILGFSARSHTATTTDVNLLRLAVSSGLARSEQGRILNPFVGDRFALAAVTTDMALDPDLPLAPPSFLESFRAKGPSWWLGSSSPKNKWNFREFGAREYRNSRFPVETLKRVEETTTFIDEARIPRVPKSSEFFLRAAFGDLGKAPQEASKDGYSVAKAPLAAALRLALNVYSVLQRGEPAKRKLAFPDRKNNADLVKATLHFLGADIAGVSRAPDWVWYSHRQDGTEMPVAHPFAATVMIDQGFDTMEGASGDDWISSAQSMRTYMRAGLVCSVLADHLRRLGYDATAHSAADSDVIQTPLVLLAGLGEVSRIGETILNPFLGPRSKTGVMTTDFPIEPDKAIDFGLQNFCESCNKCARECPSGAISAGPKVMFNGYEIWKADVEKCTRYRMTNLAGSMCGRCMKACPWNLAGLVQEKPFRWAAMHIPVAAQWLAKLDDYLNRGEINPRKKWWWDITTERNGSVVAAKEVNVRGLNKHIRLKYEDQTLAAYPAPLAPLPLPMPSRVDREAGIEAYKNLPTPDAYKARIASGDTDNLVPGLRRLTEEPPVVVAKVSRRWASSKDGKIDLFEIVSAHGLPLPKFDAGAHVDVTITPEFIRQFSLAGDPADRTKYVLGILREDQGRGGSLKIHQMLRPGVPVVVSTPRNHFPVMREARRHLLLAGGIGVTPLIAMGHELYTAGKDFVLYYKAKTRAQAAFIQELESVAWSNRVHFHFSDERRLDIADVLREYVPGDHVYTCGPAAFMDAVFDTATTFGWDESSLHREYFSVPEMDEREKLPFKLRLGSTGQIIPVSATQNAVQALASAGLQVDVKCSDGLCGVCAVPYLSGDVDHRDFVLSKEQRKVKMITCCSRAATADGEIVLNL